MITGQGAKRHRCALVAAAGALAALCTISGCGGATTPVASTTTPADPRLTQPLPGATATSLTLGVIPYEIQRLDLSIGFLGGFGESESGLSDSHIADVVSHSLDGVGGRTITVTTTRVTVNGVQTPSREQTCAQQRTSSVVITYDPDPQLIDCLIKNGSIIIDASGQPWDTQALTARAPYLWATATAAADTGEKVLLAQAQAAGVLKGGTATVVSGPDPVTTRVADSITIPGLRSTGATTTSLSLAAGSDGAATPASLYTQAKKIVATNSGVVRTVTPLMYVITASTAQQAAGPQRYLITSNDNPFFVVAHPESIDNSVPPKTSLLGWAPVFDGTQATGTEQATADPATAAACGAPLGTPVPVGYEWSAVYRFCDAVDLAKMSLSFPGVPTPASFRDTAWSNGTQWKPAAVSANGWNSGTYTGANLAQWFTWNPTCKLAATDQLTGCFEPSGPTIPLTG